MPDRKMCAILALSCALLCPACATDTYHPAPIPPAVETVTVYRDLPDMLLAPCAKPSWNPAEIETDIDLLGLTARISDALDRCADQVDGIRAVYRQAVH
uniref:Uncharacterized protein n=1 Tax=uncultured bacterium 878 TaxID=548895 RepID=B8R8M1_9BACT|nr:hypothetical protein [uncultured bacterium 878]